MTPCSTEPECFADGEDCEGFLHIVGNGWSCDFHRQLARGLAEEASRQYSLFGPRVANLEG